jgi:glycosyltransferase involved in cell wall biosynthesis
VSSQRSPELSVVLCSLNGADGVDRALAALAQQTIAPAMQVVVVDDGSTDGTAGVARAHGAHVVRHEVNRGLSAARNTGIAEATAPVVAFLDDDCIPDRDWAERLLGAYTDATVMGVGGEILPTPGSGLFGRYLERHNPLEPLEADLGRSETLPYRLALYLRRQWSERKPHGLRDVYGLVGANMSFRREALAQIDGFDERFTFGADELDLCVRLRRARPDERFVLEPAAVIRHDFDSTLSDMLRRSRAYGRGSARMFRKWPSARPTFFPVPVLVAGLALLAARRPALLAAAAVAPAAMFPSGVRRAGTTRRAEPLMDPYLQLAQETAEDVGFLQGLWLFRDLEADTGGEG